MEGISGKVSGAWVIRGTRVPVSAVFENFRVTREQVQTVLAFAARSAAPIETVPARGESCLTGRERRPDGRWQSHLSKS